MSRARRVRGGAFYQSSGSPRLASEDRRASRSFMPSFARSTISSFLALLLWASHGTAWSQTALYSIGSLSAQEQYYVELINRARANPPQEGLLLRDLRANPLFARPYDSFAVDLEMFVAEMNAILPTPPLVPHRLLREAALRHSRDIATRDNSVHANSHVGSDSSTVGTRTTNTGFQWGRVAENVFKASRETLYGHAGFVVDWGDIGNGSTGGMQNGRGHRVAIMNANFTELGVADVAATGSGIGPRVVTQVFARPASPRAYITGVAHLDLDENDFYTPGEGIGGVRVDVVGNGFRARTGNSGGFAVPVPGDGEYQLIFTARGVPKVRHTVRVENGRNVKIDYRQPYDPRVQGPAIIPVNQGSSYTVAPVPGATAYQLKTTRLKNARSESAEAGLRRVAVSSTGTYSVVQSDVKAAGTFGFHLAHPTPPVDQMLRLRASLVPTGGGELVFRSRLGWAKPDQTARVDILHRGEWRSVWTKAGTDSAGQLGFETVRIPLADYAGEEIAVRFVYTFTSGSYYPQTTPGIGWFFDEIELPNVREVAGTRTLPTDEKRKVVFIPSQKGWHLLRAEAQVSGRYLRPGAAILVRAQ
jgi:uncharacterized protein YkwD